MADFYDILGVRSKASQKEIKSAYRKLARKLHPDHNPGDKRAEDRFKKVSEAYDVLGDKKKREQYDLVGHRAWKAGAKQAPPPGSGFGGFPGGGFGGGGWSQSSSGQGGFDGANLEDLLGGLFGGGRRARRRAGPMRGEDSLASMTIPRADAVEGAKRTITLSQPGAGPESLTVTIPKGIVEGQKIRLAGKGHPGLAGGPSGDLLIEILFESDERFERLGEDLTVGVKVPFSTAALGGSIQVPTLGGSVELTVPAGTQGGQRFRLAAKGLPKRGSARGDLFARVRIVVPRGLDEKGSEAVELLKRFESD